jgi:hypothetical protein
MVEVSRSAYERQAEEVESTELRTLCSDNCESNALSDNGRFRILHCSDNGIMSCDKRRVL